MTDTKIQQVNCLQGYQLDVILGNGHRIIYNMEPKLVTARFRELADWRVFCSAQVTDSGRVIRWNENTELSIMEIMFNVNHGKDGNNE